MKRYRVLMVIIALAAVMLAGTSRTGAMAAQYDGQEISIHSGIVCNLATRHLSRLDKVFSSDRSVATVTKDGRILAFREGKCTITAVGDGSSESVEVVVDDTPAEPKRIALTFDDGPGEFSDELLDFLKDRGVHVTYFMIGNQVSRYSAQVKRMYEEGHELGNHSFTHPQLTKLSGKAVKKELKKTDDAIYEASGAHPTVMRPPYGATNATVLANINYPVILWNVDTLDWKYRDADYVAEQVYNGAKDGNIILVHEIHRTTIDGVKKAIDKLLAEGWQFMTVTQLLTCDGSTVSNGTKYSSKKFSK